MDDGFRIYDCILPILHTNQIPKELIVFSSVELAYDNSAEYPVDAVPDYYLSFFHFSEFPYPTNRIATQNDIAARRERPPWSNGDSVTSAMRASQSPDQTKTMTPRIAINFFMAYSILQGISIITWPAISSSCPVSAKPCLLYHSWSHDPDWAESLAT